jgi:GNAT superfamily N-acetyltransferase
VNIEIREPRTAEEMEAYYELRWRILREPWTQARESGKDEHESQAIHLTAWAGDELAGVGRVHMISSDQAQIRYMAVEPRYARRGIGGLILAGLEERARRIGARSIVLNARDTALGFYRKHGYRLLDQSGTLFESIVHWKMRKDL